MLAKVLGEVCHDMEPGDYMINISIGKTGQISVFTEGNRIDVTRFPDGQTYYTNDWDRILNRTRKESNDDTL